MMGTMVASWPEPASPRRARRRLATLFVSKISFAFVFALATTLAPTTPALARTTEGRTVVGGHDAQPGKWPDAVAVYVGSIPLCTGVLIAPTVVITAAHCNTSGLKEVLIGADTLAAGNSGERIPMARRIEYPRWEDTFDLLVLVLARPSTRPPRALASGWAAAEIADGAQVSVVGYGAVDVMGKTFPEPLQEGVTTITDSLCTRAKGCNPEVSPSGELGAGGMGVDSCSGDSGGPLYLETSFGTVVAGLTSRSYDDATLPCSQGGIYVRAGLVADWIEAQAGVSILRGPDPSFAPLQLAVGEGAQTRIEPNDPRSSKHKYELAVKPKLGSAAVYRDGSVRMCGSAAGDDLLVVAITDTTTAGRRAYVGIPVQVTAGTDQGKCSLDLDEGGCGCQGGGGASAWGAGLVALALFGLRRRTARRPA